MSLENSIEEFKKLIRQIVVPKNTFKVEVFGLQIVISRMIFRFLKNSQKFKEGY